MEDFTEFTEFAESHKAAKALEIQSVATEQTGFIASRLNKDNFWNLVFFVGTIGLVGVSELIARGIDRSLVLPITVPVIILSIYLFSNLLKKAQSSKELVEGQFIFGQTLLAVSILNVAFIAFPFFFLEGKIILKLLITNIVAWFISISTLYCIIKNLPLGFYFGKNAWHAEGASTYSSNSGHRRHSKPLLSLSRLRNSPINSWHSTNIYRRK